MPYTLTRSFKKRLSKKPPKMQAAVLACIHQLMTDPHHPGLNTHKMQGYTGIWEAYVDQANRVTFERDGDHLTFRVNCNHDVLRNP